MTGRDLEFILLMYRTIFKSLSDHCKERECEKCEFADEYGVCILAVTPNKYDIEKIQDAILKNVKEGGDTRWV